MAHLGERPLFPLERLSGPRRRWVWETLWVESGKDQFVPGAAHTNGIEGFWGWPNPVLTASEE